MTTERGVTLTVRAASDYDPSEVFLAVRSTGGRPLYEGTASYALANDLRFTVPATVDAIEVLVRDTAGQHRAKVRLDPSGSAAFLLGRF